jgi:hypothetical protein
MAQTMTDSRFWALIATTTPFKDDADRQLPALRATLAALSAGEIEAFADAFDRQMLRSYSWDLWGAAHVYYGGGCSDDSFDYFRMGLIAQGQEVFETVLADPDSLAGMTGLDSFEEFSCVAMEVWEEKTGRSWEPDSGTTSHPEPSGTRCKYDPQRRE